MKTLLAISLSLFLVACGSNPTLPPVEQKIVERVEYLVKVPPKELMELPAAPAPIDSEKATQSIVAQWLLDNEDYINKLRNQVKAIARFLKDEQDKADVDAKKKNEAAILKPLTPLVPLKPIAPAK